MVIKDNDIHALLSCECDLRESTNTGIHGEEERDALRSEGCDEFLLHSVSMFLSVGKNDMWFSAIPSKKSYKLGNTRNAVCIIIPNDPNLLAFLNSSSSARDCLFHISEEQWIRERLPGNFFMERKSP